MLVFKGIHGKNPRIGRITHQVMLCYVDFPPLVFWGVKTHQVLTGEITRFSGKKNLLYGISRLECSAKQVLKKVSWCGKGVFYLGGGNHGG